MEIKALKKEDELRWEEFIRRTESSTFYHQIGWKKVIEKTYGHKPIYLFAEENEEIVGILPLFLVNTVVFGKRLLSVPYGSYGGCCSKSQSVGDALINTAIDLSKQLGVKYLELRNMENLSGMPTNDKYVTMLLDLTNGEQSIWSNIRKGMKACVKRAAKEDFNVMLNSKNINGFYSLYCNRMHKLGTPVPPLSFFKNILENFSDTSIATIDYKGKILASQVLLFFKRTVLYVWGASSEYYSELHPVHFLMWKVIQNGIASGYEVFDFGRSAQFSGTYDFKKWWGAKPQQLFYQYYLNGQREIPYVHPSNPKYKVAIEIWRNLPLSIANRFGPFVSKELT